MKLLREVIDALRHLSAMIETKDILNIKNAVLLFYFYNRWPALT